MHATPRWFLLSLAAASLPAQAPPPIPVELRSRFGFEGPLVAKIGDGLNMLIVDDINDSGGTIQYLRAAIEAKIPDPDRLRVAVLVHNIRSKAKAEYHGSEIDRDQDKRWYVFPWEAVAPRSTLRVEAQAVPERLA